MNFPHDTVESLERRAFLKQWLGGLKGPKKLWAPGPNLINSLWGNNAYSANNAIQQHISMTANSIGYILGFPNL